MTWPAGWVSLGTANYLPVAYQAFPSGGTADATPTWVTAATAELMLAVFT